MGNPNVTADEARECLMLLVLRHDDSLGPMTAAEIAERLRLGGSRETQRRRVRAIVQGLRDKGSMIVATKPGGYMLTDDVGIWADYLEGRQIDAKRVLAVTGRKKKMAADSRGQGLLFGGGSQCGLGKN